VKWHTLTDAAVAVVHQLFRNSQAWIGRRAKVIGSLRALRGTAEPAAIPTIFYYVLDDDEDVAEEAAAAVETLYSQIAPELLPTLDERIRAERHYLFDSDPERGKRLAANLHERFQRKPSRAVVVGLISCHASGYVRQAAIAILDRTVTSGAEVPFLLLRVGDWVDAVHRTAEQAIARRATDSFRPVFIANLALIDALKGRIRARDAASVASIEQLLRADIEALVEGAGKLQNRRARRFGLSLAIETLNDATRQTQKIVITSILNSDDPAARLLTARWLASSAATPQLQQQLCARFLNDRSVSVRRVALGWCATREPKRHLDALRAALLDRSRIIREIAQYHLARHDTLDLRKFYIEAATTFEGNRLEAALRGLGETGARPDAELVLPLVSASGIKIRRAALAALARLAFDTHLEVFVDALQSSSPGVCRQARIALDNHASDVGADRLRAIMVETSYPHVRRQALILINQLPKWQKLPLLLESAGTAESGTQQFAHGFIRSWVSTYNRTHQVQPTGAELVQLRQAIDAHGAGVDGRLRAELEAIVEMFENRGA